MTDLPLTRAIGLEVFEHPYNEHAIVYAKDLERILAKGVRVRTAGARYEWFTEAFFPDYGDGEENSASGLVIAIEPIKRETAEDVLRDLLEAWSTDAMLAVRERARRVLSLK